MDPVDDIRTWTRIVVYSHDDTRSGVHRLSFTCSTVVPTYTVYFLGDVHARTCVCEQCRERTHTCDSRAFGHRLFCTSPRTVGHGYECQYPRSLAHTHVSTYYTLPNADFTGRTFVSECILPWSCTSYTHMFFLGVGFLTLMSMCAFRHTQTHTHTHTHTLTHVHTHRSCTSSVVYTSSVYASICIHSEHLYGTLWPCVDIYRNCSGTGHVYVPYVDTRHKCRVGGWLDPITKASGHCREKTSRERFEIRA